METLIKLDLADFGNIFRRSPADLDDQELLALDFILHRAWQVKREGGLVNLGDKSYSFEELIARHALAKKEMSERAFRHPVSDELDAKTAPLLSRGEDETEKGVRQAFGSYAGKKGLAGRICSHIPYHRTYVEPFAGGGAVFWRKDPSPREVLNDRDAEIPFMYRFIRDHTAEDRRALAQRDWIIRKSTHERLKKLEPTTDRDRFYKSFYLTRSSYGKQRGGSFNPANEGVRIDFERNITGAQARLKNVAVHNKDYLAILKKYDGPETFFYMDPPYPGTYNLHDFGFKEEQFLRAIKGLKAKWIVSYTAERAKVFKGYHVYRVKRRNQMRGPGGNQEWITELMVSNFPLESLHLYIEKQLTATPEGDEATASDLPFLDDIDDLEKINSPFVSPGGKRMMARKIIELLPEHKAYVEPFAGAGHVLFHKAPSEVEALNDVNADLIFAYRFVKRMTDADLAWLKSQSWVISEKRARDLFELKPRTPRERFYRFAFLNKAHYWGRTYVREGLRRSPTSPHRVGATIGGLDALPKVRERLAKVRMHNEDWKQVVARYDAPDTLFFIDPPYPSHWPKEKGPLAGKWFDDAELVRVLKGLKGRFILSYELEKAAAFKDFRRTRIKTVHTGTHQLGNRRKYELLVSNFSLK